RGRLKKSLRMRENPPGAGVGASSGAATARRRPTRPAPTPKIQSVRSVQRAIIEVHPQAGSSGWGLRAQGPDMNRSTDRILTSHARRRPGPRARLDMVRTRGRGERVDEEAFQPRLRLAVGEIVRRQADLGIDVVDDGEFGKPSFVTYVRERLGGLTRQE